MLQQFLNQSVWAYVLEAAVLIGVLAKIITLVHYHRLMQETEQMKKIHTKWIKALKKRFDNYEQLKFKVENADIFVDKYMQMDRICGIKSQVFIKIPLVASLVVLIAVFQGEESWIFVTGINIIILFLIEELVLDVRDSIPIVKTNLILFIEKGNVRSRKPVSKQAKREAKALKEEIAVSKEKELLSSAEMETFGKIMKEWWEF